MCGNAKVFICSLQGYTEEHAEKHFELLPLWRKEKILSLKNKQKRKESILAFSLLMSVLKKEFEIECFSFKYNKNGKPYLTEEEVCFNVSHCKNAVVVGASVDKIGVDVECIQKPRESVLARIFSGEERDFINKSIDPSFTFTKIWTEKEAKAKCLGWSILKPQTCFDFSDYMVSGFGNDSFYVSACTKNMHSPSFLNVNYYDL